jgi:hypothetical protein
MTAVHPAKVVTVVIEPTLRQMDARGCSLQSSANGSTMAQYLVERFCADLPNPNQKKCSSVM